MRGFLILVVLFFFGKNHNINICNALIVVFATFSLANLVFLPIFIGENRYKVLFLWC